MLEIDFDVRRGGFHLELETRFASPRTVIFGPSGSGKSTLLHLIAGLVLPNQRDVLQAKVVLDGRVLTDTSAGVGIGPGHRGIGLVTQRPALFPHLKVAANVAYGLTHLEPADRARRVEEMLALTGSAALVDRRAQHLSGGESQRVALARALAPLPRLLLLDEPLSALDGEASDALLARLKDWAEDRNVQTIMATHDSTDALATGAEVAMMREGRLVALGPAADVLASERSRLLARLSSG